MVVAHLGIAVCAVGITMVKGYETERDVKMGVGDTVTVAGYVFRFDGVTEHGGPNYRAARGAVASAGGAGRACVARASAVSAVNAATDASVTMAAGRQCHIAAVDCAVVNRPTIP